LLEMKKKGSKKRARDLDGSPTKDIVECFAGILDKCDMVPEIFRKEKIDPIREAFEKANEKDTLITLVAETGFGKTRMVNCLIENDLFPVRDSDALFSCTMLPVIIRHGDIVKLLKRGFSCWADDSSKEVRFEGANALEELRKEISDINGQIKREYELSLKRSSGDNYSDGNYHL